MRAMDFTTKDRYDVNDLQRIMALLRGEGGCPWDREQTHASIRKNLIEEAYEAAEAIDQNDMALLREELGDVLLQVVFHAQMEDEQGSFTLNDVADEVCRKLILRHPHVFGDVQADTADKVLENWDAIKKQSKGQETFTDTLRSVPRVLPALMRAQKIGHRAARAGMDHRDAAEALRDLRAEVDELAEAMEQGIDTRIRDELGDVLFSCANIARHLHMDAEEALGASAEKFMERFARVEQRASEENLDMKALDPAALYKLWQRAKEEDTTSV